MDEHVDLLEPLISKEMPLSLAQREPITGKAPQTPEAFVVSQLLGQIVDEQQFHEMRKRNGFTDGFRGTWKAAEHHLYLYIKPGYEVDTEEQAQNSMRVVTYLTERGVLYPQTQWGIYRTNDGRFQIFAVTRELEEWKLEKNGKGRRQPVKTGLGVGSDYEGLLDQDSHVLQWMRRADEKFDPFIKEPEGAITGLLNPYEASHSDNWAWDEHGVLYPIDVEVVSVARPHEQQIVGKWVAEHTS